MPEQNLERVARGIVEHLVRHGHRALFAGGCVRDKLMGLEPKDYDIATDATPDEIMKLFPNTVAVGAQFGVVVVVCGEHQFEVATFRADGHYADGRHPDTVTFSGPEEDVRRRDFTINGLLLDPLAGKVIDHVGGESDIRAKLVRAIGDPRQRFTEDRLRMLRAVRFSCQFGYLLDAETASAIRALAPHVSSVSAERIKDELQKTLTGPRPDMAVQMLEDLGLMRVVLPEVSAMKGVAQPPNFHPEGDVFTHTVLCMGKLSSPSWELAMATLLHDIGKPRTFEVSDRIRFTCHEKVGAEMAEAICDRLKMSNAEKERIAWLVARHLCLKDADKMKKSTLKRLLAHEGWAELLDVHRVDALASNGDLSAYEWAKQRVAEIGKERAKPKPLVNGQDLIAHGLTPGPVFKQILSAIEEEQLE
ncbi:MAG: CCA tRNA nucleotidyltransferase, partial [Planctomycetes bacterium]|nr:CCA tRNA nucleotidyltransferase [Planctomycetota bacterium]